jgi:hypothetical protein
VSDAHVADVTVDVGKFQGGKGFVTKAGAVGAILTLVSLGMMFAGMDGAQFGYLMAFTYWAGVSLVSLNLLMIFHAFRAKWMTVLRRPLEAMATTVVLFLILFIPVGLKVGDIFSWVHPTVEKFGDHGMHILHHKEPYLNTAGFWIRGIAYFVFASILAFSFFKWSTKQDVSGDPALLGKARKLGVGALPFMALTLTFGAFDWLMSLDPLWFSTIFGVYYFGGSMLVTLSVLLIVVLQSKGKDLFGNYVSPEHVHNIGKLMFAFTAFWAYIAVSQFLLIWIAALPEETPWYITRMSGGWGKVGLLLIFGHFFAPFFLLLSRSRKRDPRRLLPFAIWAIFVHLADMYWLIFPEFSEAGPTMGPGLIAGLVGFVGIGLLAAAFAVSRLRGQYTVPVKDPFLTVSLRYRQP